MLLSWKLKAQIIINEVSQGPTGNKEYVELLVTGTNVCVEECVDIRGWIIDDNNGWHVSPIGTGQGIANGCVRLTDDAFWSCVYPGTIIVIYNDGDVNASMPANDLISTDNNCTYVIPVSNTTLLEGNSTQPNNSTIVDYSTITFTPGGNWNWISMANGDDSFQLIDPANTTQPAFSIGWGNNTLLEDIYFSADQTGKVIYMNNATNNDPTNTANWTSGSASTYQTPGAANNAANATWIAAMNNGCAPRVPLVIAGSTTSPLCYGQCTGTATTSVTGGATPYQYQWSTGNTSSSITGLCAGAYTVTVTDFLGCTTITPASLLTVTQPPLLSLTTQGLTIPCDCGCGGTAYAFPTGGTPNNSHPGYTVTWSNGYNGQFQTGVCSGNYTVTVTDANGCTSISSVTISP